MGSALLNTTIADPTLAEPAELITAPAGPASAHPASPSAQALRQQVAERLAAHRNRRGGNQPAAAPNPESTRGANSRAARIAAAVAERYAHTQSYRAFLAAEAERAVQQARAAAQIAEMNAQAVAQAQQNLLDALDEAHANETLDDSTHEEVRETLPLQSTLAEPATKPPAEPQPAAREQSLWPELDAPKFRAPAPRHHRPHRAAAEPHTSNPTSNLEPRTSNLPSLTVRLYEDAATAHVDLDATHRSTLPTHLNHGEELSDAEARALDEEIAFRQAPVFEESAGPPMPLPANLIEFPRQLVAPRKARPRYAEGPLRDEDAPAPGDGQLRIFEVDPAQISTQPVAAEETEDTTAPQWTSIWLDTPAASAVGSSASESEAAASAAAEAFGQTYSRPVRLVDAASISRRALASAINAAVLFTVLLVFAAVFLAIAGHWQPGMPFRAVIAQSGLPLTLVAGAIAGVAASLYLLYQALFFWLSDSTPGMRAARIALCTFDDENPSRRAMRRRIVTVLLSAVPLGLGLLWAALDEDRLAWHDRIARMYQRSY